MSARLEAIRAASFLKVPEAFDIVQVAQEQPQDEYLNYLTNETVKALEAAEASTQSALDANKLGYQVGVRINIDVLNSQSQLFQTKRDLAKARYDVLVGGLKLRQANGSLKPEDLQSVNGLLAK
jgi:outer membrane protein TolC